MDLYEAIHRFFALIVAVGADAVLVNVAEKTLMNPIGHACLFPASRPLLVAINTDRTQSSRATT